MCRAHGYVAVYLRPLPGRGVCLRACECTLLLVFEAPYSTYLFGRRPSLVYLADVNLGKDETHVVQHLSSNNEALMVLILDDL